MPKVIYSLVDPLVEKYKDGASKYIPEVEETSYYQIIVEPLEENLSESYAGTLNPFYGMKHTEEWKKNHSERMSGENNPFYGKRHTEETKRLISEKKRGSIITEAVKEKLRKINTGKKMKPESIAKTVAANQKTWYLTTPDGEEIVVENLSKYCRENNLDQRNMSKMYNGLQKTSKGYTRTK